MRSLFVTIFRKLTGAQSTLNPSTNQTGPKSKKGYINQSSVNEEHDMARMDPGKDYWRRQGTSTVAYHGDPELESGSNTDLGGHRSDSDELLRDQHLVIMKRTEVTVSEHRC